MGICCGFAAKKTAKAALVGIGLAFGSLQVGQFISQSDSGSLSAEVHVFVEFLILDMFPRQSLPDPI